MKRVMDWAVFVVVMVLVGCKVPWDTTGLLVLLVAAFLTAPRSD